MAFTGLLALIALISTIHASPSPRSPVRELVRVEGATSGNYIVTLKDGVNKADVMGVMSSSIESEWTIINGFAVEANDETLATLLSHPDVESVEEDGMAYALNLVTQSDAPWGISRLSSSARLSGSSSDSYNYTYDDSAGEGVDVYIIDTGIYTSHSDFEGRAYWGATFGGFDSADGHGHGTHCAGTAVSATYGVAKKAHVYAVKVLSDGGSGAWSGVISGMNYVMEQAAATGRPSVASMSLGGGGQSTVDAAVEALVASGVHVTVAAGNSNTDAGNTSPARAPSANTIGATDISDSRAYYSNYGSVIDLWGPGSSIKSTWIGSTTATNSISGTSMATPHIAGLTAYLIGLEGNISPAAMTSKLQSMAQSGIISDVPSSTVNLFAHNGA